MAQPKFYANGIRIGEWFYRSDGSWLHHHDGLEPFTRKWYTVVECTCVECEKDLPPEIRMHGRLQQLRTADKGVETYWPVVQARERGGRLREDFY